MENKKKRQCALKITLITNLCDCHELHFSTERIAWKPNLGFIGSIKYVFSMYDYSVGVTLLLKYTPYYRINQDHVERFFWLHSFQRGHDNNPT